MSWLVKQVFIEFLSFNTSLFMSSNNEQCKTRLTLIDLNPIELKYYLFMISLNKCNANCSAADKLDYENMFWIKQKA